MKKLASLAGLAAACGALLLFSPARSVEAVLDSPTDGATVSGSVWLNETTGGPIGTSIGVLNTGGTWLMGETWWSPGPHGFVWDTTRWWDGDYLVRSYAAWCSPSGCHIPVWYTMSTVTVHVRNNRQPVASFTYSGSLYEGQTITFTENSTDPNGNLSYFTWMWPDGSSSTYYYSWGYGRTVSKSFGDSRGYTVALTACDVYGACSSTAQTMWLGNLPPTITGVGNNGPIPEGSSATITVWAYDPGGDALHYHYDCTNDGVFDIASPASSAGCSYASPGSYTVRVRVGDDEEAYSADRFTTVTVYSVNSAPTANAGPDQTVGEGTTVSLNGSATDPDGDTLTHNWSVVSFIGPAITLSATNVPNPTFVATDNGTYTLQLTATDPSGASASDQVVATVNNVAPTGTFTAQSPVNEGSAFNLALTSVTDPSSVDVGSFTYAFDCGDGAGYGPASAGSAASCPTTDNGARTAKGKVLDKDGGSTEYIASVTIENAAPSVAADAPTVAVNEGQTASNTGTFSDPATRDDVALTASMGTVTKTGAHSGTWSWSFATTDGPVQGQTVTITASDGDGGVTTASFALVVNNVAPTATLMAQSPVNEGSPFTLALANPADPSSADTSAGFTYAFDCGDGYGIPGASSTASCPTTDNGTRMAKGKVIDKDGGATEYTAQVTVNNVPPAIAPLAGGGQIIVEGGSATITVSATDAAGAADTLVLRADCNSVPVEMVLLQRTSTGSVTCTFNDNGVFTVTLEVTDDDGGRATAATTVTVNNVAPTATFTAQSPVNEGSPFTLALTNPTDPSSADTAAGFSYAFDCGSGWGAPGSSNSASCPTTDSGSRTARGKVIDKDGGRTEYTAQVTVNNVAPALTITAPAEASLYAVNTAVNLAAAFTDPGTADTHTCQVTWDDGTTSNGTVAKTGGSGTCTAGRSFGQAGVYTIGVALTDDDGGSAGATLMVVVYDPSAGFVTGGGWINSPAGAYAANANLSGKATFGFVSRYKPGASVPSGQTEFQFHAAGFNFHSSDYQWLVVAGAKAQYKGTGTVNGAGGYSFLLTATDGQVNGGGVDKFRVKIWNGGGVVYDNVKGASDDLDAASPQAIAGGSIVIHNGSK